MPISVLIRNYRCIDAENPVEIRFEPGFTAFIGKNNSGKSSLLKFFFDFRWIFEQLSNAEGQFRAILAGQVQAFDTPAHTGEPFEMFRNASVSNIDVEIHTGATAKDKTPVIERVDIRVLRDNGNWKATFFTVDGKEFSLDVRESVEFVDNTIHTKLNESILDCNALFEACKQLSRLVYIPAYRNVMAFAPTGQRRDGTTKFYDVWLGQPFITFWDGQQTGYHREDRQKILAVIDDLKHIFGFSDLTIQANSAKNDLMISFGGQSYGLHELGAGLGQFVLTLGNAAFSKASYILIDEPELDLHASLQLDFLTSLASYASKGVVFATHNLGLARQSADRVYAVRTEDSHCVVEPYAKIPHPAEFIGELSFGAFEQIGCSRIVLVEGKTELQTVQQILRLYGLDHQVVLVPLMGGELINPYSEEQLAQITRITPNISALIDSERTAARAALSNERQKFKETCDKLKIDCHVLERRAMENYFPDSVIKSYSKRYRALGPYEKLEDVNPHWSKKENWRIARKLAPTDLAETDLGVFVADLGKRV